MSPANNNEEWPPRESDDDLALYLTLRLRQLTQRANPSSLHLMPINRPMQFEYTVLPYPASFLQQDLLHGSSPYAVQPTVAPELNQVGANALAVLEQRAIDRVVTDHLAHLNTSRAALMPATGYTAAESKLDAASEGQDLGHYPVRQPATFPSERSGLSLVQAMASPTRTLKLLGSTLRSKADPFFDVTTFPDPGAGDAVQPVSNRLQNKFFPDILHRMLDQVEQEGFSNIVCWLPHGRAFRVHDRKRFCAEILPRFFVAQTKWTSFSRQLNMYGFLRTSVGVDAGSYYHELFIQRRPMLCRYMRRVGAPHGPDRRTYKLAEGEDPDFYSMGPIDDQANH